MKNLKRFAMFFVLVFIVVSFNACAITAPIGGKPRYYSEEQYDCENEKKKEDSNEKKEQYNCGNFSGVGDYEDLARIKNDKENLEQKKKIFALTIEKLKEDAKNVQNGANKTSYKGYKGMVANFSRYRKADIVVTNIVTKISESYFLSPGEQQEVYLVPGNYNLKIIINGKDIGDHKIFTVGIYTYLFQGKRVHWYACYDPDSY
ncbi:hypothetical protein HZB04_01950 [Candidatus Wolfebacteria bacterium]|nr:hypothetical protein [Candidatus Wolfebacteria bacterium]